MKRTLFHRAFFIYLTLFQFSISNNIFGASCQQTDHSMFFAQCVQKRYYVIQRLTAPLRELLPALKKKNIALKKASLASCQHSAIQLLLSSETLHHAIARLWSDCNAYRYLETELFSYEFVALVVHTYLALYCQECAPTDKERQLLTQVDSFLQEKKHPFDELLYLCDLGYQWHKKRSCAKGTGSLLSNLSLHLDQVSPGVLQEKNSAVLSYFDEAVTRAHGSYDTADFVLNNAVCLYTIKRLTPVLIFLSELIDKKGVIEVRLPNDKLPFKHPALTNCIKTMRSEHSLTPLKELWHRFTSYSFVGDALFLREFSLLLVIMNASLFKKGLPLQRDTLEADPVATDDTFILPPLHDVIELYQKISMLPLPELFYILDVLVEQGGELIQMYELTSDLTWRQWFQQYWWVPPVALFSFGIVWLKSMEQLQSSPSFSILR